MAWTDPLRSKSRNCGWYLQTDTLAGGDRLPFFWDPQLCSITGSGVMRDWPSRWSTSVSYQYSESELYFCKLPQFRAESKRAETHRPNDLLKNVSNSNMLSCFVEECYATSPSGGNIQKAKCKILLNFDGLSSKSDQGFSFSSEIYFITTI